MFWNRFGVSNKQYPNYYCSLIRGVVNFPPKFLNRELCVRQLQGLGSLLSPKLTHHRQNMNCITDNCIQLSQVNSIHQPDSVISGSLIQTIVLVNELLRGYWRTNKPYPVRFWPPWCIGMSFETETFIRRCEAFRGNVNIST